MEEKPDKNETTSDKYCPKCHHPLTEVGAFWICPQHGQVSFEKPNTVLRIFLSYGHDANDELVFQIKADLEKSGHDVWFDKSEIKFGDEWRRSITDGILQSNRVLSFLSKHSTNDPGVCLDEIAIAIGVKCANIQTILIESETEMKPPTASFTSNGSTCTIGKNTVRLARQHGNNGIAKQNSEEKRTI